VGSNRRAGESPAEAFGGPTDRLGKKLGLGLPFVSAVGKALNNQPQKLQQNRFHQCRNLDGAFEILGTVPSGPVLLVDDIVDSGWTMTVIAALLLQAGSGPVWPLALATTSSGA
jgi:ATP-dependent DNA helicase RecQ